MKRRIRIVFEEDPAITDIEVLVRAPVRDGETEALLERIKEPPPGSLIVSDTDGAVRKIDQTGIVSVSVNGKLVQIVTEEDRLTVRQPLQSIEDKLDGKRFVRISRYEIVNLDKVVKFDFTLGGTLRLELTGGMETWASRRNISQIRKKQNERM